MLQMGHYSQHIIKRKIRREKLFSGFFILPDMCVCVCVSVQQQKTGVDKRECCLQEIRQTEEKYSYTLESLLQVCAHVHHVKNKISSSPTLESNLDGQAVQLKRTFEQCFCICAALYEASRKVSPASRP